MSHCVGAQSIVKLAKNAKTYPHFVVTPRRPQIQKQKIRSQVEDLLNL